MHVSVIDSGVGLQDSSPPSQNSSDSSKNSTAERDLNAPTSSDNAQGM